MKHGMAKWMIASAFLSAIFGHVAALQPIASQTDSAAENTPRANAPAAGDNLSDKLDKTNGVLVPNGGVDAGMAKTPPAVGATPVIRPPGGTVQPK
jgi:hypothetical protein